MARENTKDSAKAKQLSAGRNLNRAAKLVYSFHFCPHCHKNYLVYWLFFCCQLFFSDKQSSKRFTCTHNPIFQPCHWCHFRLPFWKRLIMRFLLQSMLIMLLPPQSPELCFRAILFIINTCTYHTSSQF